MLNHSKNGILANCVDPLDAAECRSHLGIHCYYKSLILLSATGDYMRYISLRLHYPLLTLVNVYVDCWYLRVLPVLHRPEVVDIGVNTI